MSAEKNYKELIKVLEQYQEKLKKYTEEQFQQKPSDGGWSLAQVYSHIITADRLSARGIEKALQGNIPETDARLKRAAWWLLLIGKIPGSIQAPAALVERTVTYENKEQAEMQIKQLLEDLAKVTAQKNNWNKKRKIKHPFLGLLNSFEWLRFMEIHTKHHLKQLDRIEKEVLG